MDKYPYLFNFFIGGNEIVLEGEPMRRFNGMYAPQSFFIA